MKNVCDEFFDFKSILVWHKASSPKESYGMGYHYRKSCEFVLLYSNGHSTRHIVNHGTLLHYPRNQYKINHPTPKPLEMIKLFVKYSSDKGMLVVDPFMGSGTTAVACRMLNRDFVGFEISKEYCRLAEKRLKVVAEQVRLF